LVEPAPIQGYNAMPGDDRIKAKIADAVRSRQRIDTPPEPQPDPTRPLTKGRGRRPDPLVLDTSRPAGSLPPEPPMTGDVALPPEPPVMALQAAPQVAMPAEPPVVTPQVPAEPVVTAAPTPQVQPQVSAPVAARVVPQATVAPVMFSQPAPQATVTAPQPAPQATIASVVPTDPAPQVPHSTPPMQQVAADPVPRAQPAPISPQIPVAEPRRAVVEQPVRKPAQPSRRAQEEAQPALAFEEKTDEFELPPLGLLANPMDIERHHLSDEALEENARMLENVLDDYGVKGEIVSVRPGPVVTMYELEPAPGLKASRVIGLADDIARSMSALSARVSTVPGRSVIGIELPNENREKVVLREILASRDFGDSNMSLPLALGKDIGGDSVVANLAKMPHLLIAGTTGSGKSVAINTMILSLLYKLTPDECRLIMIDPKMLELSVYDGIPHLLSPVVTDPKKAVVALKWTVGEMEDRYRKMSKMGVRNIEGYNGRVREALNKGEMFSRTVQTGFDDDTGEPVFETEEFAPEAMPFIVVIVDEMADLMMVAGKEIEACIQRLAQMARASGIHLIMATQRPSVDVITGTIKANFPTRISFQVTSKIDSRTILGEMGAEQLLGMGDMLYMAGGAKITRCHGPFVSDEEVEEIVNHLKAFGPPQYMSNVLDGPDEEKASNIDAVLGLGGNTDGEDALYDTAVAIVIKDRKCSTSYIQRKLAIGYNKAARLVEQMEDEGLVSPANHVGKREILVPEQQ
jgi:DNA segregation ATPase FtsK/SpoIIIE, S-DNA-T family